MNDCIFCDLLSKKNNELCSKLENTILYEDDFVIIKPALGMSIPNYLMVISKKHLNGFAELNSKCLLKVERLLELICEEYVKNMGIYPIIFEHGSLANGRHKLSITHAHLHIIPINLSKDAENELFAKLKLVSQPNVLQLKKMIHEDYWMYRSQNRKYYMSSSIKDAPRSCFIKIVAKEVGYDDSYEWRDSINNRKSDVEKTISTFKKFDIKKQ